tara:strand:- start:250 stop:405 length:156 start_codon:yes stop_codon:yes gene_type:complete
MKDNKGERHMTNKDKDPFGFDKAINWDKLNDPKVLKELEEMFKEREGEDDE